MPLRDRIDRDGEKTLQLKTMLMLSGAGIVLMLGLIHLFYTFHGTKLLPRDPALVESMKSVALVITEETTVWKAWIGFNASHSMAAILFGLIYGYLALAQPQALFGSVFLQVVGFLMLGGLLFLSWRYWFSVPFYGIAAATFCYAASLLAARLTQGVN